MDIGGKNANILINLSPQTNYCYRVRAYVGFSKSEVSDFSNVKCIKTRK
ncbi:MAG: hypothetical protein GY702_26270 [Desulfobulbaceae bacterium]|nr:hypothetical protein [Desulfobulbaceae bacterium]